MRYDAIKISAEDVDDLLAMIERTRQPPQGIPETAAPTFAPRNPPSTMQAEDWNEK
jgi:hypothetical protein